METDEPRKNINLVKYYIKSARKSARVSRKRRSVARKPNRYIKFLMEHGKGKTGKRKTADQLLAEYHAEVKQLIASGMLKPRKSARKSARVSRKRRSV